MNINGNEISEAAINAALLRMQQGQFKAKEIELVFVEQGVSENDGSAMRAADRLIQKQKKANKIKLSRPFWKWIEVAKS